MVWSEWEVGGGRRRKETRGRTTTTSSRVVVLVGGPSASVALHRAVLLFHPVPSACFNLVVGPLCVCSFGYRESRVSGVRWLCVSEDELDDEGD